MPPVAPVSPELPVLPELDLEFPPLGCFPGVILLKSGVVVSPPVLPCASPSDFRGNSRPCSWCDFLPPLDPTVSLEPDSDPLPIPPTKKIPLLD